MKQAVLKHWDIPWLPISALVIFVLCFVLYTLWTYSKQNRPFYEKVSFIPLEDPQVKGSSHEK